MVSWWITGGAIVVGIIVILLFEESRDWLVEAWEYFITFEWISEAWEFFIGMFTELEEFSVFGLGFAALTVAFVYALRKYMLYPFLAHMTPATAIFWMVATYVGCGAFGYLVGKKLFDE